MNNFKRITALLFIICCMVFCTSCGNDNSEVSQTKDNDKLLIVTSIYPIYDFTCKIAGDNAKVINLVPAGVEPHDFELSTGDMRLLESADMFIYNGAGMEAFVDKTLQGLSNKELVPVEAAKNAKLIENGHITDPHTWLSIENAKAECEAVKNALIEIDPAHGEAYQSNYSEYIIQLDALIEEYKSGLEGCSKKMIVVAHEAFGYMCDEFGLTQQGIEGVMADAEPDSARMKELIDICRDNDIKIIFFEELVSPKVAETIAAETGAQTMVLNPIEGLTSEQEEQNMDYIILMRENLKALQAALK